MLELVEASVKKSDGRRVKIECIGTKEGSCLLQISGFFDFEDGRLVSLKDGEELLLVFDS